MKPEFGSLVTRKRRRRRRVSKLWDMRRVIALLLMAMGTHGALRVEGAPGAEEPRLESAARLEPCAWGNIAGRVECGALQVPENRARPGARALSLFFVVARATAGPAGPAAGRASADPVFFFTGGPGSAASRSAEFLSAEFGPLRATRDLVFIDQRGTGRSAPLVCSFPQDPAARLRPMFDAARTEACRQALAASADLRFYTTSDAVLDVEDVRKALGYRRLNLHGSSYGTRAAWAYAARFPERTRAMLLHGPAPPGFHLPVPFARGLDTALEGVIAACEREAACAAAFPSLRAGVAKAFDNLRAAPARVRVGDTGGPMREGDFSHGELAEALRYQLYTVQGARRLPQLLARAAAGDYQPIAQASIENRRRLEQQLARGMFLSVTCAEDVPFMNPAHVRAASSGTRLGDYRVRQQVDACATWPRGEGQWWAVSGGAPTSAARGAATPGGASPAILRVPTLVQVGEFDPATPVAIARSGMPLLPNGRLLVIPHGAHAFGGLGLDDCLRRINNAFFARASVKNLDTSCTAAARRPPFAR